jgi:hypothetical protein
MGLCGSREAVSGYSLKFSGWPSRLLAKEKQMTDTSNTDTHRGSSTHPKSRMRHVALAVLKVAYWLYGTYKAVSKAFEFARSMWTVLKNWWD